MRFAPYACLLLIALFISGCGGGSSGGGSGTPPPPPPPPPPTFSYDGVGLELLLPTDSGDRLSVIAGESVLFPISVLKADDTIPVELSLQGAAPGIALEDAGGETLIRIDGTLLAASSDTPFTVIATNTEKNLSVEAAAVAVVLAPSAIASGVFSAAGGELLSADGSIALSIEPGELSSEITLGLVTASTPDGAIEIRISSPQDLSSLDANLSIERRTGSASLFKSQAAAAMETGSADYDLFNLEIYDGLYEYYLRPGKFGPRLASFDAKLSAFSVSCGSPLASIATGTQICVGTADAAALFSTKAEPCFDLPLPTGCDTSDRDADFQPVLFVHGFSPIGRLGGDEPTWGRFLDIAEAFPLAEADAIVAFEFRWRTNASFRVVADDLAAAIARINELTGRPVHIIAHSFGGILVRTVLKNQTYRAVTEEASFDSAQVLSVLTLGTPHSGIYDKASYGPLSGQLFPEGQDSWWFETCLQLSCWQMGERVAFFNLLADKNRYDAGELGEHLDRISTLPITSDVPMVVGIGLALDDDQAQPTYRNGDRLIRYDGQRASPMLVGEGESLKCEQADFGPVTEVVLGVLDENGTDRRPDISRRPGEPVASDDIAYAHSASLVEADEHAEPYVTICSQSEPNCVRHAAIDIFAKILLDLDLNAGAGITSSYCVAAPGNRSPSAPSGGTVIVQDNTSLLISWSPSVNGLPPYTYTVYDVSPPQSEVLLGSTQETDLLVTGLAEETEYCFQVEALDQRGSVSSRSSTFCASTTSQADATEGWLVFQSGDPGIPNDGISVAGEPCPSTSCGYREFTPVDRIRLGPNNSPITISVFEARFGFFLRFRLVGYPDYCTSNYADSFGNGDTPPYDGVPGRFLVIDETIFTDAVNQARNSYPECTSAPDNAGYISRIDVSTGGADLDAAYLAFGADVFPDDGLPPINQDPGWVSFYEGNAGVPDDGILVLGQPPCQGCAPQHSIVEELALGTDADGLTLSVYGTAGEALDEVLIRFNGFPAECESEIPTAGQLPNAPTIRGVLGKYISLSRSQLAGQAQVVAALNPGACSGVSANDAYYAAFTLSGDTDLVDGAFVGVGANSFPSE